MGTRIPAGYRFIADAPGLAADLLAAADEVSGADRELGIRRASGPNGFHVAQAIADQYDADNVPATPTGLTATADADSIVLAWTAVADPFGVAYRVYRDTSTGVDEESTLIATVVGATTFDDTTVEVGTAYFYAVTAVRLTGTESEASDEATDTVES